MGMFKGLKDMKQTVAAAPGLIEQAQQMQANGLAMQQNMAAQMAEAQAHQAAVATAVITPADLEPINGVDLEAFAQVSAGLAAYNYDTSKAVEIAAARGIAADDWTTAVDGWNERIKANPAVAKEFNRLYTGR